MNKTKNICPLLKNEAEFLVEAAARYLEHTKNAFN